jgi:hypothetical protein
LVGYVWLGWMSWFKWRDGGVVLVSQARWKGKEQ